MKRFSAGVIPTLLAIAAVACAPGSGIPEVDELAAALPDADELRISMDAATAATLVSALASGDTSFRAVTRSAMAAAVADVARILAPVEALATAPLVVAEPDRAEWQGPAGSGDGESLVEVRRMADRHFEYALASRSAAAGAAWEPRVAGSFTPGVDGGQGSVWIDLANGPDGAAGKILVLWSDQGSVREVAVFEYAVAAAGDAAVPGDSAARFHQEADGSGQFVFAGKVPIPTGDDEKDELETPADAIVITRWTANGAGRVDVHVLDEGRGSGELQDQVVTQCWTGSSDKPTYSVVSGTKLSPGKSGKPEKVIQRVRGDVDTCPWSDPAPAVLPTRPDEPPAPPLPTLHP